MLLIIKVYNLIGEEVIKLVNKTFVAGNHKIQFDASRLSGGVYFYRIIAGDFTDVKKLMLLK